MTRSARKRSRWAAALPTNLSIDREMAVNEYKKARKAYNNTKGLWASLAAGDIEDEAAFKALDARALERHHYRKPAKREIMW